MYISIPSYVIVSTLNSPISIPSLSLTQSFDCLVDICGFIILADYTVM